MGLKSKICYMGHRLYLPLTDVWHKSRQHDEKQEIRAALNILFGQDIINQLNSISFPR